MVWKCGAPDGALNMDVARFCYKYFTADAVLASSVKSA